MSRSYPSAKKVGQDLDRLKVLSGRLYSLAEELDKGYEEAYDASLSSLGTSSEPTTLGRGFQESDPTGQAAVNPKLRQLRWNAGKAAKKVSAAVANCEEALSFLGDGFRNLDDREWAAWVAKRIAATQG